jgi:hypothetical protein
VLVAPFAHRAALSSNGDHPDLPDVRVGQGRLEYVLSVKPSPPRDGTVVLFSILYT